jgi:hypothetical protein
VKGFFVEPQQMGDQVEVTVQLQAEDYQQFMMWHYKNNPKIRWIIGLLIFLTLVVLGLWRLELTTQQHHQREMALFLTFITVFFWTIILIRPLRFRSIARRNFTSSPLLQATSTHVFSDKGITTRSSLGSSTTSWQVFHKIVETPRYFLCYEARNVTSLIPKRNFTDQQHIQNFRAIIQANVPTEKCKLLSD